MTAQKSSIPAFKNHEEEAAWFEAHMADIWSEAKPVKVRFAKNLTAGLNIRLDPHSMEQLRSVAHKKGIGPTTLARMWIKEHLNAARS
jgi:hypothetical protein